ncbi:MAG: flagellar basal body P-ring protein FlgI [Planctomycetales bacterium]|nr:flagellar basal body P-ring protein FlgI [Planctomycetales bacterium]
MNHRFTVFAAVTNLMLVTCVAIGCKSSVIRSQNPDADFIADVNSDDDGPKYVGDMARVWGLSDMQIEGVAMVAQLENTGSDPPQSDPRDILLNDMRRRGIRSPGQILGTKSTAMVLLKATIPPGALKGDRIDVAVRTPPGSETTSLRNGWLMQARMQEMARLGAELRSGRVLAHAEGAVIVDAMTGGEESDAAEKRGLILGGGIVAKDRPITLVLRSENHGVPASRLLGRVINDRFHTYDRGVKQGAATPKRDTYVELAVQSQYRHNLFRYARVVEALALRETERGRYERLANLREDLLSADTAKKAAIQLEAIGHDAAPALLDGIESDDPLVRFCAAEALAYLNHEAAVPVLVQSADGESAMRWHALTALGAMSNLSAKESLRDLLNSESAETQYGAFHVLRQSNRHDVYTKGDSIGDVLVFHEVRTTSNPMIHIRKTERPEIVVFGQNESLQTPFTLSAGKRILVKGEGSKVKITRFSAKEDNTYIHTTPRIRDVIEGIVKLGGSYTDIVGLMVNAKEEGSFAGRVMFDALPRLGREYHKDEFEDDDLPPPGDDTPGEDDGDDDSETLDFT